ncbi:histone-lysine N-methyltransferase SUVR3 [Euphorbia lathyris]|uniref:histone-lysine N-methyltransferase SUVR3 n=1 Tax=Euphorbia lathyris TaxID=212925 RepID=UPI003313419B
MTRKPVVARTNKYLPLQILFRLYIEIKKGCLSKTTCCNCRSLNISSSFEVMQQLKEKKKKSQGEEDENQFPNNHSPLIQCGELILPWLTPPELACIAFTCKALSQTSKTITLQRSFDASRSFENRPIPFHNALNYPPYAYFLYTPSLLLASESPQRQPWGFSRSDGSRIPPRKNLLKWECGCDCEGCEQEGEDGRGFLDLEEMELGIMSECGPSCGCGLDCGNRLTQRGVSVKLKIVREEKKGWSLYADQLIPQGQFVCEYSGELLTTEEARRRQQIYDDLTSHGQFYSALLVVREHLPSGKACLRVNIDATRTGNVARFINHSCDGGNLSTILVRSSGALLPRLCFFASKDIREGEELTFSYGETRVKSKGLQCFCGSSCCFGILPSEHT